MTDVLNKLQSIFRDIFDNETLVLKEETSMDDIEGWDSLAQINIIMACEVEFNIKFILNDITSIKNVGDVVAMINRMLIK